MLKKFLLILVAGALTAGTTEAFLVLRRGSAQKVFKKDDWLFMHQIYKPLALPFYKKEKIEGKVQYQSARSDTVRGTPINMKKSQDEIRIAILGESLAENMGNWILDDPYAKNVLESRFPGKKVTFINAGKGAYISAQVLSVAGELIKLKPDIILVIMGNSIFSELDSEIYRFDAKTWRLMRSPLFVRKAYLFSWVCRTIIDRIYSIGVSGYHDIGKFNQDYEDLAKLLVRKKIPFSVFTIPSNYADCPPNSIYCIGNTRQIIPNILVEEGRYREALDAIGEPGEDAFLWYLEGEVYRATGSTQEARDAYLNAMDIHPSFRPTRPVNETIKRISKEYGAFLVETDILFENLSDDGLLGNDFFIDECHWFSSYNTIIIDEFVRVINSINIADNPPVADSELLPKISAERLNEISIDERKSSLAGEYKLITEIAKASGGIHVSKSIMSFRKMIIYQKEETQNILSRPPAYYVKKISAIPEVSYLADQLEVNWYRVLTYAGEAFRQEGDSKTAVDFFDAAIAGKPGYWEPYFLRAMVNVKKRNQKEAEKDLKRAGELCKFDIPIEEIVLKIFNQ